MIRIIISAVLISCISCSDSVEIYFPTNFVKENKVMLNNKHDLNDYVQDGDFSFITLNSGEIQVSINGEIDEIKTTRGGFLNLNKEEFVIFPVVYGDNFMQNIMPYSVVIDSIIYYKGEEGENENFFIKHHSKDDTDPNVIKLTNGISKIKEGELFKEKVWSVGINSEIPKQMKFTISNDDLNKSSRSLYILRTANFFKLYAMVSGEYSQINLRDSVRVEIGE